MQKISPIKQRILQFLDLFHNGKQEFYRRTGISRGTIDNDSGLTEESMAKFLATFPEVNPEWLVTGVGEVVRKKTEEPGNSMPGQNESGELLLSLLKQKDSEIMRLSEEIGSLKEQVRVLRKQVGYSQNNLAAEI